MTISNTNRVAGPFPGNGSQTVLPFTFKVFQASEVVVVSTDPDGVDTELMSGFVVNLNGDQDVSPGGTVTMNAAPAFSYKTTLTSSVDYLQPVQLEDNGGFYPRVLNNEFDRLTILIQQVLTLNSNSLKFPISDGVLTTTLPTAAVRADKVLAFDTDGNVIISNLTLAAIESPGQAAVDAAASAAAAAASASNALTSAANALIAQIAAQAAQAAAEAAAAGMKWRPSVRMATTANIALTGVQTIDGVVGVSGDLVLVKNQSTASQNGVYTMVAGAWARTTDADAWIELISQVRAVEEGTVNADLVYICTANQGGTIGVTAVNWTQLSIPIPDGSLTPAKFADQMFFASGQCRLVKVGANLVLIPKNGNKIIINGVVYTIPSGGITLAPTSTVLGTGYYIYAYVSGGVPTLERDAGGQASTTHTTHTNGIEIKTGDATRSLVGWAYASANGTWGSSIGDLASWYNRQALTDSATLVSAVTGFGNTGYTELSTTLRIACFSWGGDSLNYGVSGACNNNTVSARTGLAVSIDGGAVDITSGIGYTATVASAAMPSSTAFASQPAEGRHIISAFGFVTSGNASFYAGMKTWVSWMG